MSVKEKIKRVLLIPIKIFDTLKKNGIKETLRRIRKTLKIKAKPLTYKKYLKNREKEIKSKSINNLKNYKIKPSFHFFIRTLENNSPAEESLKKQIYKNFKISYFYDLKDLNNQLKKINEDYFQIMNENDSLFEDYLYECVIEINKLPDSKLIYTDEEYTFDNERKYFFKPEISLITLTSEMYLGHPIFKTNLAKEIKFFDNKFEEAFEWDLALKFLEKKLKYSHVKKITYINKSESILGLANFSEGYNSESKILLKNYIERNSLNAEVIEGLFSGSFRIKYKLNDPKAKVTIIIPTYNNWKVLDNCIRSIEKKSSYKNFEIIIVNNNSTDPQSLEYFKNSKYKVLELPVPFNFSLINNVAYSEAKSEFILFLNNDTEVITPDWLESMMEYAQNPEFGLVGAKLLYPDNSIQHAGLVMGIHGIAAHGMKGFNDSNNVYFGQSNIAREVSAVTGACIMIRSELFEKLEKFDEKYTIAFQDLDLSMKSINYHKKVIYTPFAKLYHYESKTRGKVAKPIEYQDGSIFINKWGDYVAKGDPFYNPNLTLEKEDFSLK